MTQQTYKELKPEDFDPMLKARYDAISPNLSVEEREGLLKAISAIKGRHLGNLETHALDMAFDETIKKVDKFLIYGDTA